MINEKVTVFEGVKYREVKRKASVGERIKIVEASETYGMYKNGDVFTVEDRSPAGGVRVRSVGTVGNQNGFIDDEEYVVLEPITEESETVDLIVLQRQLNEVKRKQAEIAAQVDGLTDAFAKLALVTTKPKQTPKLSDQQIRDNTVEQAKADVKALISAEHFNVPICHSPGSTAFYTPNGYDTVEFVVNTEKRTAIALIKARFEQTSTVWAKGIAKAAPDDCFNIWLGKAISLRRALGLEVPDEYVRCPQPTEVRVGDVVEHTSLSDGPMNVTRIYDSGVAGFDFFTNNEGDEVCGYVPGHFRIIDDSRTDEGEVLE